jgi:hypothetical protein
MQRSGSAKAGPSAETASAMLVPEHDFNAAADAWTNPSALGDISPLHGQNPETQPVRLALERETGTCSNFGEIAARLGELAY